MAEIMTAEIALSDHCQECILNIHKTIDRGLANNRRCRWRHAYKCRRKRG